MINKNPLGKMESLLSKQALDYLSVGNLMGYIKEPCLILDKTRKKILQVNSDLISLTAFSREELCQAKIENLINDIDLENGSDNIKTVEVKRKNRTSSKCRITITSLNDQGTLLLMTFHSININNKVLWEKNDFIKFIFDLGLLQKNESIDEYLIQILNKLKIIYESDNICIYIADDDIKKLKKRKTTEFTQVLPEEIPISEVFFTGTMDVWRPGKRVLTDIQRAARANGIARLIQIPLDINEKTKGLLVLGSNDEMDTEKTYEQLPYLAQIINSNLGKKYKEIIDKQNTVEDRNRAIFLECILNNVKLGIMVINSEKRIVEINSYLEQLFGFSKWEVIDNAAQSILPDSFINAANKEKDENQVLMDRDLITNLHRRDGSEFPAQLQFIPLPFYQGIEEVSNTLVIVNDLSKLDQLLKQNKQQEHQAEMGVLVASFAHDVRNVFNSIKLNAETAELKSREGQSLQEYTENIKEDCDRINQLMESVLSFSSSIEDNSQSLDVTFLLQKLIERWNPKLERARIRSILQFDKDIPQISADPRSLEQVFNNLFSNARDAMSQTGGTLGILITKKEQESGLNFVEIKISDSGPGIPEEFITKIFDPYFSSRPGGTGLGLAITKRIVDLHHGQINVESFPGGTTFTVVLPEKIMEINNK